MHFLCLNRHSFYYTDVITSITSMSSCCKNTKLFTTSRDTVGDKNAVSDFRARRLSPASGCVSMNQEGHQAVDNDAATVAELWAINAQLRPVSKLIQALEADSITKGRVAWPTFESIHSRLTTINSLRRQMKHIADLTMYTEAHFGGVAKLHGED